jgi:hypothetical protein
MVISGERPDKTGFWRRNRFPAIIVEYQDSVFVAKQHATLRILCYRENLAHLTVVVSGESSKNWVSKFSIGCKDDACITKQKESEALDHLEKHLLELVGTAPFNPKNRSRSTPLTTPPRGQTASDLFTRDRIPRRISEGINFFISRQKFEIERISHNDNCDRDPAFFQAALGYRKIIGAKPLKDRITFSRPPQEATSTKVE